MTTISAAGDLDLTGVRRVSVDFDTKAGDTIMTMLIDVPKESRKSASLSVGKSVESGFVETELTLSVNADKVMFYKSENPDEPFCVETESEFDDALERLLNGGV